MKQASFPRGQEVLALSSPPPLSDLLDGNSLMMIQDRLEWSVVEVLADLYSSMPAPGAHLWTPLGYDSRYVARDSNDIEVAVQVLKDPRDRACLFSHVSDVSDAHGDPPIHLDQELAKRGAETGARFDLKTYSEEDQFRKMGSSGPIERGKAARAEFEKGRLICFQDPLDGSANLASGALYEISGASTIGMHRSGAFVSTFVNGRGDMVIGTPKGCWYVDLDRPYDSKRWYEIDGEKLRDSSFDKPVIVLPLAKNKRLAQANAILSNLHALNPSRYSDVRALPGGNPGFANGFFLAVKGATAGYQPSSYAWDAAMFYPLAQVGLTVVGVDKGEILLANDLQAMFITDLLAGKKTQGLIVARDQKTAFEVLEAVKQTGE